jgi:hypothetical protein
MKPIVKRKQPLSEDGILSDEAIAALERYATRWVRDGDRDLQLERRYPTLTDEFFAVRTDAMFADRFAVVAVQAAAA